MQWLMAALMSSSDIEDLELAPLSAQPFNQTNNVLL